jgi:hypothetical protein
VNSLDDIFDLQDQITESVVGAIGPKLERAEIERVRRKPTESLHAYDLFLRGMASLHLWTRESTDVALELFYKAMERDPDFVTADGLAAWCYVWRQLNGWTTDRSSLNLTGLVNVGAPFGLPGTLLLDPYDFIITRPVADALSAQLFAGRSAKGPFTNYRCGYAVAG